MNSFLATLLVANIVDVQTAVTHGLSARLIFTGVVIYQV